LRRRVCRTVRAQRPPIPLTGAGPAGRVAEDAFVQTLS
jgi:hypothetical protein